jgi:hypothetical protein
MHSIVLVVMPLEKSVLPSVAEAVPMDKAVVEP